MQNLVQYILTDTCDKADKCSHSRPHEFLPPLSDFPGCGLPSICKHTGKTVVCEGVLTDIKPEPKRLNQEARWLERRPICWGNCLATNRFCDTCAHHQGCYNTTIKSMEASP